MSTRFPMDVPMDIEIFKSISLQAFDDYKRRTKDIPARIRELESKKKEVINAETKNINYLIRQKSRKILLIRKVIICLLVALIFLSPILLIAFIDIKQFVPALDSNFTVIALIIMTGLIGVWWLCAVFNADSDIWKWVSGLFLFGNPISWWAAIFCLILYFFVLKKDDTEKIYRSLARKPNNRKMLTKAKKDDKEDTALKNQKIDAEIALLKREASKEGEYEWLYRVWKYAFDKNEEFQYWADALARANRAYRWDDTDDLYKHCIGDGPDKHYPMFRRKEGAYWGIVYNDYETPNRYIEITVEAAKKERKYLWDLNIRKM